MGTLQPAVLGELVSVQQELCENQSDWEIVQQCEMGCVKKEMKGREWEVGRGSCKQEFAQGSSHQSSIWWRFIDAGRVCAKESTEPRWS